MISTISNPADSAADSDSAVAAGTTTTTAAGAPLFANTFAAQPAARAPFLPQPLDDEIRKIYARSPLYAKRFPLPPAPAPLPWARYLEIPALSKREIVERGHEAFFADYALVERGLREKKFEYESTSGTTSGPMTVIMEDGWWAAQTRRAYRAHPLLAPFADAPHRKCVLAPVGCSSNLCPYEDHPFPHRYFDGTVYLNLSSDPFVFPEPEWDRILLELQAVQPDIIEGEPIYLSLLARAAKKRRVTVPSIKVVILTYGKASLQHSRRVAEVFPAPQVDLYGSTEAGYIFIGEAFKDDSRVIDANAFVELTPCRGAPDVFQIHVTTRDREAMPLLRYHTGDIVRRCPNGYRLLGREGGLHFRQGNSTGNIGNVGNANNTRNGDNTTNTASASAAAATTIISPTEIDAAIPANFSCWHYSLVQTADARWDFHYVADTQAPPGLEDALAAALGDGARVNAFRRRAITPAASGKFALLKPLAK